MSVSGGYFLLEDFFSPARFNRKTVAHLTGSQISTLNPSYPNQLVVCTETGSGFTVDNAYFRNTANTAWLALSGGKHKHDVDTEAAGGLLWEVFHANLNKAWHLNYLNPSIGEFSVEAGSSGSSSNDNGAGRVSLATGVTNSGYAHAGKHGVKIDFTNNSRFMFKGYATANTFLSIRMGVAMENVNASLDVLRKYGIEACDSAGVGRNYDVISADGTSRSAVASTEDVSQAAPKLYQLDFTTAQDVKFFANGVLKVTKTTNVPAGNRSAGINNIGFGIKTNNTTGKNLFCYGVAAAGNINDEIWL